MRIEEGWLKIAGSRRTLAFAIHPPRLTIETPTMACEFNKIHQVADFVPQSVINAQRLGMRIATFP